MSESLDIKEVATKMNRTPRAVMDIPPQTGKLAVVTGANSGIGWHAVLELARAGG
jgi:NADP-dependent 3-hydroxy acid dehydrogenase YdfG